MFQYDNGLAYCMGIQPQAEYLLLYNTDFIKRLHDRSYFNLFWLNSFSHNHLNLPMVMDRRIRRFLKNIQPYLNSTIVLFFSDHGCRVGPIRKTYIGWLEERLPFMYFWIPPSFRANYPRKFFNLLANRNRLTSPFDVYATLQDILYGQVMQIPDGCLTCNTLFQKVKWDRSCEDAGISSHWCPCFNDEDKSISNNDQTVIEITKEVIQRINSFIIRKFQFVKSSSRCAMLSFKKILSVRSRRLLGNTVLQLKYIIVFEVDPSGALYELTWDEWSQIEGLDNISRINMYNDQSWCVIGDSELKKYCYCIDD